jgi:hypothetical protein
LTLPAVTRRIYASDEVQYVAFLRSLWFDRDVSFENEYRAFSANGTIRDPGFAATFMEPVTETGLRRNFGTIGSALLWAPFYAAADAGVRTARALGAGVEADGYSWPYISAVCIGSAVYGLLALLLAWHAARRVLAASGAPPGPHAALAAAAAGLGTPLLFYMYVAPGFAHATSAFAVAAFLLAWLVVRERWSVPGMALLGALAGLMAMVREQDAFVIVGPAIDFVWALARERRRRRLFWPAAAGAVMAVLAYLPQAAAYVALNGRLGPSRLVSRKMTWSSPHAAGVVASPEHGLLFWTPLALLAVAGLVLLAVRPRPAPAPPAASGADASAVRIGIGLLAIVLAQVYVAGSVESWTVAGAFGQRRFVALTAPFVIGLAVLGARVPRRRLARVAAAALVGLCVWWNLGLVVQFGAGLMDRQRLDWRRNAYNTFVEVPRRLPEIACRYLFERGSFYRQPPPGGPS